MTDDFWLTDEQCQAVVRAAEFKPREVDYSGLVLSARSFVHAALRLGFVAPARDHVSPESDTQPTCKCIVGAWAKLSDGTCSLCRKPRFIPGPQALQDEGEA